MNISMHSFVTYTGYVSGYYNSSKQLTGSNVVNLFSNRLMPLPLGINTFQVFNFPRYLPSYSTLRMYDPVSYNNTVNGITTMKSGEFFSTTRDTKLKPLDVRVIGWSQPSLTFGLTQNLVDYDER